MNTYHYIGVMSGSSLDGLDLALVEFKNLSPSEALRPSSLVWKFLKTETISYADEWVQRLKKSTSLSNEALLDLDLSFGNYLGNLIQGFLETLSVKPTCIGVHGHTVYHEPSLGYSMQIGAASAIAKITGIPAMDNFRNQDIGLGGQGAPLAPTAEHWLFPESKLFLNLGGIGNISFHNGDKIQAFDLGIANQLLNSLANEAQLEYDNEGQLASRGTILPALFSRAKLNIFYKKPFPKSLSNQWCRDEVLPLFKTSDKLEDRLATAVALINWQIELAVGQLHIHNQKLVITGGGAMNNFLIGELEKLLTSFSIQVEIPSVSIISYKEAALMALMAFLNIRGMNNCLAAATGSRLNHCSGVLALP